MGRPKKNSTKPIIPANGDVPTKDGQSVKTAGPPICPDNKVCVEKPPAQGAWHLPAEDGVITGPWQQNV